MTWIVLFLPTRRLKFMGYDKANTAAHQVGDRYKGALFHWYLELEPFIKQSFRLYNVLW